MEKVFICNENECQFTVFIGGYLQLKIKMYVIVIISRFLVYNTS